MIERCERLFTQLRSGEYDRWIEVVELGVPVDEDELEKHDRIVFEENVVVLMFCEHNDGDFFVVDGDGEDGDEIDEFFVVDVDEFVGELSEIVVKLAGLGSDGFGAFQVSKVE